MTDEGDELERLRFARMRTELDPHDPDGHLELGVLLLANGRVEAADSAFERVLEIEPGDANARYFRAVIAQSWGRPSHATRELAALIRRFPNADLLWQPLRDAVDGVLRRSRLYAAMCWTSAALLAVTWSGGSVPLSRGIMGALLLCSMVIVGIRWRSAAGRIGRALLRSLVRMRVKEDWVLRLALLLDGLAVAALVATAFSPPQAWRALSLVTIAALVLATILQAFRPGSAPD